MPEFATFYMRTLASIMEYGHANACHCGCANARDHLRGRHGLRRTTRHRRRSGGSRVADAESGHPHSRAPRRRSRTPHHRRRRRRPRRAPIDRVPAGAHARRPRSRRARLRQPHHARRAHGRTRLGRLARPAGRGAPRADVDRERARHHELRRGARPVGVHHHRERRTAPRGRVDGAASGLEARRHDRRSRQGDPLDAARGGVARRGVRRPAGRGRRGRGCARTRRVTTR